MNRHFSRRKPSRLVVSLLVLFLAPLAVLGINRLIDIQLQPDLSRSVQPPVAEEPHACEPLLEQADFDQLTGVAISDTGDGQVSARVAEIFAADQAGRLNPLPIGPEMSSEEDRLRRIEVLGYLRENKLHTARDLVRAAYVFQHGDCSEHYRFANKMAELAMNTGDDDARWLYAATLDRYLMSLGRPQKYGTQHVRVGDKYELYAVDPGTTDEERRRYNVPELEIARQGSPDMLPTSARPIMHILESWWLTIIGTGMNLLCVVLVRLDSMRNKDLARVSLATALGAYLFSIAGHYSQAAALAHDPAHLDSQSTFWLVVVALAGLAFAIQLSIAVTRLVRRNQVQPVKASGQ